MGVITQLPAPRYHNQPLCLRLTAYFCRPLLSSMDLGIPSDNLRTGSSSPERVPPFWLIPGFSPAGSARLAEELRQKLLHALLTVSEGNQGIRAVPQKNLLHVRRSYWRNITYVRKDGARMPWFIVWWTVCVLFMWVCCMCKHTSERRTVYFSLLKSSVSVVHTTIAHTTMQKKVCFTEARWCLQIRMSEAWEKLIREWEKAQTPQEV